MKANDMQVGGKHYMNQGVVQHWDIMVLLRADYFQGQITKYISRWRAKNGVQDLHKSQHFLQKYIEAVREFDWSQRVTSTRLLPTKDFNLGVQALNTFTQLYSPTERQIMTGVMLWKETLELNIAMKLLEELIDAVEQEEGYPTSGYTNQG